MIELQLCIGGRPADVLVKADPKWPGMWRVVQGARVSDMVNLSRAKDASIAWARPRGLGGKDKASWNRRESSSKPSPVRDSAGGGE
jgi:hypothetical protein